MAKHNRNTPFRVYKRGETYHARISLIIGGQRVVFRQSTGATQYDAAVAWCTRRIEQIINSPLNTHEISLDAAAGRWWHEYAQYLNSAPDFVYKIGNLLKLLNGDILLSQISKTMVNAMVDRLRARGNAPSTINRYLCVLSAICRRARDNWECHTPDFKILSFRLREPRENIKYFTDMAEIQKLVDAAPEHLRPIIWCALYTGLRRMRVLTLKWDQIDWANNQIIYMGKDNRPHAVPMAMPLRIMLENMPRVCEYVFTYHGKQIKDIKHAWHTAFDRAKIPYRSFHALRHTTATWLLQRTGNLRIVQNVLGHSNISVTTKYAHLVNNESQAALNATFN